MKLLVNNLGHGCHWLWNHILPFMSSDWVEVKVKLYFRVEKAAVSQAVVAHGCCSWLPCSRTGRQGLCVAGEGGSGVLLGFTPFPKPLLPPSVLDKVVSQFVHSGYVPSVPERCCVWAMWMAQAKHNKHCSPSIGDQMLEFICPAQILLHLFCILEK